jgi:hypothetical protein
MTTTLVLNLIAAIFIVGALVGVSRLAHRVAGGILDPEPASNSLLLARSDDDAERLAA